MLSICFAMILFRCSWPNSRETEDNLVTNFEEYVGNDLSPKWSEFVGSCEVSPELIIFQRSIHESVDRPAS